MSPIIRRMLTAALLTTALGHTAQAQEAEEGDLWIAPPCQLTSLELEYPHIIRGSTLPVAVKGTSEGECAFVELDVIVGDGETQSWTLSLEGDQPDFEAILDVDVEGEGSQAFEVVAYGDAADAVASGGEITIGGGELEMFIEADEGHIRVDGVVQGTNTEGAELICARACVDDEGVTLEAALAPVEGDVAMVELPGCEHPTVVACRAIGPEADTGASGGLTGTPEVEVDPDVIDEVAATQPLKTLRELLHNGSFEGNFEGIGDGEMGRLTGLVIRTTGMGQGTMRVPIQPTDDAEDLRNGALPGVGGEGGEAGPSTKMPFGAGLMPDLVGMSNAARVGVVMGPAWNNFVSSLRTPAGRLPVRSNDVGAAGSGDEFGERTGGSIASKLWSFAKVAGSAVATTATGAAVGIAGAFVTVVGGIVKAQGDGFHDCGNMAGGARQKCEQDTTNAANEFKEHKDHASMCHQAFSGQPSRVGSCKKKAAKKHKEFCQQNPNHTNCKKTNNGSNNSDPCKTNSNSTQCKKKREDFCKKNPNHKSCKKPSGNTQMCHPDEPNCQDTPGPVTNLPKTTHPKIQLGGVHCGNNARTVNGECQPMEAVSPQVVHQMLCKKRGEVDGKCENIRRVRKMTVPNRGDIDPANPEDLD